MVKIVLVLVALSGVAAADPCCNEPTDPRAKEHLDRGRERHDAGDYEVAIAEYRAGFAIQKLGVFLFAMAQSERAWGKCDAGDALFKQWLAMNPPDEIRQKAEAAVVPCTKPAEPVEKPPPPPRQPLPPPGPPWYRDTIGGVLTSAGAATLGVGITFGLLANNATRDASKASTIDGYDRQLEKADSRKQIAVIGIGVGSALIVGGVLRYAIEMRSSRSDRTQVAGWADRTGGGLVVARPW